MRRALVTLAAAGALGGAFLGGKQVGVVSSSPPAPVGVIGTPDVYAPPAARLCPVAGRPCFVPARP